MKAFLLGALLALGTYAHAAGPEPWILHVQLPNGLVQTCLINSFQLSYPNANFQVEACDEFTEVIFHDSFEEQP